MAPKYDAGLVVTPEMRRILDKPGFLTERGGGTKLRHLYVDGSANFDVERISPFGKACFFGFLDDVQKAVESGEAPALDGTEGAYEFGYATLTVSGGQRIETQTPEHFQHAKVLEYLISKGMPVDVPDIVGQTALYHSTVSLQPRVDLARILLSSGKASANHRSRYGEIAIMGAFQYARQHGPDVVNLLMQFGSDLDLADADGMTGRKMFVHCGPAVAATVTNWLNKRSGDIQGGSSLCASCGNKGLHVCSRCKVVRYCSTTCQRAHWSTHKTECIPVSTTNTVTVKPFYNPAMGHIIPTSVIYSAMTATPPSNASSSDPKANSSYGFQARDERKKSRPIVVKIQVPFSFSTGTGDANSSIDLLVYTKKKDFVCGIRKMDNPKVYNQITKVVREKGVAGAKGYFSAHLVGRDELVVKVGEILDAQPW